VKGWTLQREGGCECEWQGNQAAYRWDDGRRVVDCLRATIEFAALLGRMSLMHLKSVAHFINDSSQ
jgi:hypothetical protein